jgi:adenylate kinase family enzyme
VKRVVVLGVTGCGKTTFGQALSGALGVPFVELDALYWQPNWTKPDPDQFRARLSEVLASGNWVADGNYGLARDIVWRAADTAVWLDYELPLIVWRLLRRTLSRTLGKHELWGGINRERFATQFFSRDSLFVWAWHTHPRYRRELPVLFGSPAYAHLQVIRFGAPASAAAWLAAQRSGGVKV